MTRAVEARSVASQMQGCGPSLPVQRACLGATDRPIAEARIKMLEINGNWLYIEVGRHWPQ
jgi:hypothetical protein